MQYCIISDSHECDDLIECLRYLISLGCIINDNVFSHYEFCDSRYKNKTPIKLI